MICILSVNFIRREKTISAITCLLFYRNQGATIGKGHYAVVQSARHKFSQRDVAVKVIDKIKLDDLSKAHLFQEVTCMKLVQHPNIVRLYEVIDTPARLYLFLELADGGDMYDYIMKYANGLNESLARTYFQQICRGLQYCHEMRVCHRDLKVNMTTRVNRCIRIRSYEIIEFLMCLLIDSIGYVVVSNVI
jgi:serine/threonine protein kinase